MAASPSPATLINRLFTIVVLVLTLYTVYRGYQLFVAYGKLRQANNYYKTENFYRTVADSLRRTLPPPPPTRPDNHLPHRCPESAGYASAGGSSYQPRAAGGAAGTTDND